MKHLFRSDLISGLNAQGGDYVGFDPNLIYALDLDTNASAGWQGGDVRYHPDARYAGDDYPGWLGTTEAGAISFGGGQTFGSYRYRDFAARKGQVFEVYWVLDKPTTFEGEQYKFDYLTMPRLEFFWFDAAGREIGEREVLYQPTNVGVYTSLAAPSAAATFRVQLRRRNVASSGTAPFVLYYLQLRDVTDGSVSPYPCDPERLPWPWAFQSVIGESRSLDFRDSFAGSEVSRITLDSAPAKSGISVSGTTASFAPTGTIETAEYACFGAVTAKGARSLGPVRIPVLADHCDPMTTWDEEGIAIPTIHVEAGQKLVVDPQFFMKGGVWPITASFTSMPAWLRDVGNGVLEGEASGEAGAQTKVVAVLTDAIGAQITVTIPVEIFSVDRANPTEIAAASGTIADATGITYGGAGPEVFRLVDGDTYDLGNLYGLVRNADAPVIIMGPTSGMAYINPGIMNRAHGIWFEGNITFRRTSLPSGDLSDLAVRTAPDFGYQNWMVGSWTAAQGVPRCFNRYTGVTFQGYETDLSNETGWRLTLDENGGLQDDPSGKLPTTGPASRGVYGGGIEVGNLGIVQGCRFVSCAFGVMAKGKMSGLFDLTFEKTRVDHIRIHGAQGLVVTNCRAGHDGSAPRTNSVGSEHQDAVQSADAGNGCGERVAVLDCFFVDVGWYRVQAIQMNMGGGGSYSATDHPSRNAYDWIFRRNVITASEPNAFNPQGFIGELSENVLIGDPESRGLENATYAQTRRDKASGVVLTNNILTTLTDDTSNSAWTLSGNLVLAGACASDMGAVSVADIFPNLGSSTIYNDPREAVANGMAADTARFWRDDASGYTQGPAWLNRGK
ncbi:hypothetical protein ACN2XU_15060 [Primorskyibacter sp. 2E107]|uniref:hypothetical protein n=1 Tax=Primorskyibacter sp. 2E107 TaxID=3403458 RepID=UPI003AF92ACD